MFSDDFCCKLLAWVFIFGGGNEAITLNKVMRESIFVAQKRLNLLGGEVPNAELLPLLQKYIRQAEYHENGIEECAWVNTEINKRYALSPYRFTKQPETGYSNG
jgi:hypothetical protein